MNPDEEKDSIPPPFDPNDPEVSQDRYEGLDNVGYIDPDQAKPSVLDPEDQ